MEGKIIKRVTDDRIVGKRRIRRPRTRWRDVVKKDITINHVSVEIEDRWSELLMATMNLQGPLS